MLPRRYPVEIDCVEHPGQGLTDTNLCPSIVIDATGNMHSKGSSWLDGKPVIVVSIAANSIRSEIRSIEVMLEFIGGITKAFFATFPILEENALILEAAVVER